MVNNTDILEVPMDELLLVREFLKENDYCIIAEITDHGCIVVFPVSLDMDDEFYEYVIEDGKLNGVEYPKYAIRPFILSAIFRRATLMMYDPDAISFNVDDDEVCEGRFMDSILIDLTDEELTKEASLVWLITECVRDGFTRANYKTAKKRKIVEGYNIIKELFV